MQEMLMDHEVKIICTHTDDIPKSTTDPKSVQTISS